GEDGRVQGALDLLGIPYVGCGATASGVAMDKEIMKQLFLAAGLPVTEHLTYRVEQIRDHEEDIVKETGERLGYPCFVKPAGLGSSVGVSRVNREEDLPAALRAAAGHDEKILVERAVTGVRELECSVLGNSRVRVAGPGEIIPAGCFYDYDAKYFSEQTQLIIPAPVSEEVAGEIRRVAELAFHAVTARGMARVDFFYQPDQGRVLLNEINTIPGFTDRSMYPLLLSAEGLSFEQLVDELIDLALQHHR
ncbi:MAG: D-alanine--D-alanine ligase family protein, partial [Bacillota bacterium]